MKKKPTKKTVKPKKKRRPTMKQRKALRKIVENHGNVSKAMREAGYSKKSAKNPKNLTKSEGFQALLEKLGITDDALARKGKEFLAAKRLVGFVTKKGRPPTKVELADYQIQHKAWETFLKLRGYLKGSTYEGSAEEVTELTIEERDRMISLIKRVKWE